MITKKCKFCGEDFEHRPSRDEKYCCLQCYHADIKIDIPDMFCSNCGKKIEDRPKLRKAYHRDSDKVFCCRKCYHQAQKVSEDFRNYNSERKGKLVKCECCGKEFYKKRCQIKRYKRHFCSRECYFKVGLRKIYPRTKPLRDKIQSRKAGIKCRLAKKFDLEYEEVPNEIVELNNVQIKLKNTMEGKNNG